ncbi:MAG: ubiquinol-cytochrome C chaperone family protein [Acetobacteraceae bacterium]
MRLRRNRHERAGFQLYAAAVSAARDPWFYATMGVPDTLDGRFDILSLFTFLLIERLRLAPAPGPALAQSVFDAMFSDMDVNLREMGVGDLSVGKKVKAMWNAFHGRATAYGAALSNNDLATLEDAVARNVWRGAGAPVDAVAAVARMIQAQHDYLGTQKLDVLAAGHVLFLPAAEAAT